MIFFADFNLERLIFSVISIFGVFNFSGGWKKGTFSVSHKIRFWYFWKLIQILKLILRGFSSMTFVTLISSFLGISNFSFHVVFIYIFTLKKHHSQNHVNMICNFFSLEYLNEKGWVMKRPDGSCEVLVSVS